MEYVVKNATASVHSIALSGRIVVLAPGNNSVSDKDWEDLKTHPKVSERITSGKYVMIAPDVTNPEAQKKEKESGAAEGLSLYATKKAQALVKETYDLELLKKWAEEESRTKVASTIKAQIKKVESK